MGFCAAVLLAGCAPYAPLRPPAQPISTAQLLNDDPTSQCLRTLNNDPRLRILEPRIGSLRSAGLASVAMLSSRAQPSSEEKAALQSWGTERQRCLSLGQAYRTATLPAWMISTLEDNQYRLVLLTARLYRGEVDYGGFNTERQQMGAVLRQRLVEFEQQRAAYPAPLYGPIRPLVENAAVVEAEIAY